MKPSKPPHTPRKTTLTEAEQIKLILTAIFITLFLNLLMTVKILEIVTSGSFSVPFL